MGSEITAGGTVRAAYIKDSTISSMGEILSDKEIIDSVVETAGICSVKGNIISSKIIAGKGIQANNIGSRTCTPNHLQVGSFTSAMKVISQNEANPVIRVLNGIFADTHIESPNASIVLKDDYFNVTIREIKRSIPPERSPGPYTWEHQFQIIQT